MSTWICLALASLLSCAGQLCQKQATRPSKSRRRGRHILGWLGLALLALGGGMLLWLSVLQSIPVSVAYPMLSLNFVWVTLAAWGSGGAGRPAALGRRRADCGRHRGARE
jgi:undecaprenyl phosphate-alpha-L-ara4N flippase subunit ArnE